MKRNWRESRERRKSRRKREAREAIACPRLWRRSQTITGARMTVAVVTDYQQPTRLLIAPTRLDLLHASSVKPGVTSTQVTWSIVGWLVGDIYLHSFLQTMNIIIDPTIGRPKWKGRRSSWLSSSDPARITLYASTATPPGLPSCGSGCLSCTHRIGR